MKLFVFTLSIIVCTLFSWQVNAQKKSGRYSLSGKVTDASGAPLAGASVYIPDLQIGNVAGDKGNYIINDIPSCTYLVEIKFI